MLAERMWQYGADGLLERTHTRYPYRAIVSHRYPLEQIAEAFAQAAAGKAVRTALTCG